jgi:hypothetical protein
MNSSARQNFGASATFSACGYNYSGTTRMMFGYNVKICASKFIDVPIEGVTVPAGTAACATYVIRRYVYGTGKLGPLTETVTIKTVGGTKTYTVGPVVGPVTPGIKQHIIHTQLPKAPPVKPTPTPTPSP